MWIDIENASGTKQGDGPIRTARYWESTKRLNLAGTFKFSMPLTDSKAALASARQVARAYAGQPPVEVGAGIIDTIGPNPETLTLEIGGNNLLRELALTIVGDLAIDDGAGGATQNGPTMIAALFPATWSLDTGGRSTTVKSIQHTFAGDSVLAALVKLAELTGERFRLGTGRKVTWMWEADQVASGIRAVHGGDPSLLLTNPEVCLITDLQESQDTAEAFVGRLYAAGKGNGSTLIDLNGASVSYSGYAIGSDSKGYYLEHTATWNSYHSERRMDFKDIELQTTLVEQAYEWMRRQLIVNHTYRLVVANLATEIQVGDTVRVVYKRVVNGYVAVNIDADMVVLETTNRIDATGSKTVAMQVSTVDRWPESDVKSLMASLGQSQNYYQYSQPVSGGTVTGSGTTGKMTAWSNGASKVIADVTPQSALTTQLTTITHTAPSTPDYAVQDLTNSSGYGFVTKDEGNSVLAVIANLQTRLAEMETKLRNLGPLT